jgi:hypothetical protein
VKNEQIVKLKDHREADALRILRQVPGLTTTPAPTRGRSTDVLLHFADGRVAVAVEFKQRAHAATAWQVVHQHLALPDVPLVLVAGETTEEARRILRDHGIGVIDGTGNAHLELPGLLIHLEGRPRPAGRGVPRMPTRLSGKAGVVAQLLLLHSDRTWKVVEVAEEAGVSTGLAHRVLDRLEREGILTTEGRGPRRVRRVLGPAALLDLWAEEHADRPRRTFGYLLAQTPQLLIEELGSTLARAGIDYALTGAAAGLVAPFLTTVPVVDLWVTAVAGPEDLLGVIGAEAVTTGHNVVFLQDRDDAPLVFREQARGLWLANRFRLYVDLLADPRRGREQAQHLRREVIGF